MTTRLFSIIATHPLGGILTGLDSRLGAVIAGISISNVLRVNGRPIPKSSLTGEERTVILRAQRIGRGLPE